MKISRMKLTEPQKEAIKLIGQIVRLSRVNPYPVHRATLRRLLDIRVIELTLDECDYKLTNRGRNLLLGINAAPH